MHKVGVAINAGRAQRCVCHTPSFALRLNCVRVMAAAASDAVLRVHFRQHSLREFQTTRLPDLGIAEIMGKLGKHVAHAQ